MQSADLVKRAFANRMIKALMMVGADMINGRIVNIQNLDQDLLRELGEGYKEGFDLAKASKEQAYFMLKLKDAEAKTLYEQYFKGKDKWSA